MTTQGDSPVTLTAGETMAEFSRVKLQSGRTAMLADAVDYGVGVIQAPATAIGDLVAARLDCQGSSKMIASAAIAAGARVYAADGGKVAPTGSLLIGTALDASTGNNSVISVMPTPSLKQSSSSSSSSSA